MRWTPSKALALMITRNLLMAWPGQAGTCPADTHLSLKLDNNSPACFAAGPERQAFTLLLMLNFPGSLQQQILIEHRG